MKRRLVSAGAILIRSAARCFAPCLILASTLAYADETILTSDDFLHQAFPVPPEPKTLWLDQEAQEKLKPIFGHVYPQARLRYWRDAGRTAWILDEIGKEFPITAGFVVEGTQLSMARLLIYRESRGEEIRYPSFLKQFNGAHLQGDQLQPEIDGISGATLSVAAMQRMARAALVLDQLAVNAAP